MSYPHERVLITFQKRKGVRMRTIRRYGHVVRQHGPYAWVVRTDGGVNMVVRTEAIQHVGP